MASRLFFWQRTGKMFFQSYVISKHESLSLLFIFWKFVWCWVSLLLTSYFLVRPDDFEEVSNWSQMDLVQTLPTTSNLRKSDVTWVGSDSWASPQILDATVPSMFFFASTVECWVTKELLCGLLLIDLFAYLSVNGVIGTNYAVGPDTPQKRDILSRYSVDSPMNYWGMSLGAKKKKHYNNLSEGLASVVVAIFFFNSRPNIDS